VPILSAGLHGRPGASQTERPNALFLAVDDWNDMVGALGDNQAITPNLDRLAKRGVAFTNAHTPASYCAPARTALMTGLYPTTTGCYFDEPHMYNRPDVVDLPAHFGQNGYMVHGGGKLYHHMPGFIDFRGWDEYFIWHEEWKKRGWGLYAWDGPAPLPPEVPASPIAKRFVETGKHSANYMDRAILPNDAEERMADTKCANWSADFLKQDHEKPFFLGFGTFAPHKPNYVPRKYFDLYPPESIKLPPWKADDLDDLPPLLKAQIGRRREKAHDELVAMNEAKNAVRGYLAALSYADAMMGRVLDALDGSPHAENTIVVLCYHLGEKGCWAKKTLWERTSNVPLLWAGPGIPQGVTLDTTVSIIDTYPTLAELCGLPKSGLDGASLAPIFRDPSAAKDRTVLQTHEESISVIDGGWRYTRYERSRDSGQSISPRTRPNRPRGRRPGT